MSSTWSSGRDCSDSVSPELRKKAIRSQIAKVEKQIEQLVDSIADGGADKIIAVIGARVEKLERERLVLEERIAEMPGPKTSYSKTLRTALSFLANPWNLWVSGQLDHRKTVLKLAFPTRLQYQRQRGFRKANIALPFKMLADISGDDKRDMARRSEQNCEHLLH